MYAEKDQKKDTYKKNQIKLKYSVQACSKAQLFT